MAAATQKIRVNVAREVMFDVISDYESYPKFLSTLTRAKILERSTGWARVEFEAKIVRPFRYTLELTEKSPTSLAWEMTDGDFMRKNVGKWTLKKLSPSETEATYSIEVELSRLVPDFMAKLLVNESLPATLDEFRRRAEGLSKKSSKKK